MGRRARDYIVIKEKIQREMQVGNSKSVGANWKFTMVKTFKQILQRKVLNRRMLNISSCSSKQTVGEAIPRMLMLYFIDIVKSYRLAETDDK